MAYNTSIYLTILLAFERYLCVCCPKKAEKICTPKKTKIYIFICVMIGIVYTIPRIFQRKYGKHYEIMKTTFGKSNEYNKGYLTWSDFVYRLILPTLCLAFFNIAIFREVSRYLKKPSGAKRAPSGTNSPHPLLIFTDFLKDPFRHSFQTGIKIQL